MAVAVSPDGKTLAIDMQGSIWTLPATGGTATRITGLFNDARQPVWSPDGKWITFFGYLDGGYNIWTIAPDGTQQHKLTWGSYDDREPAYSHDGRYIAFASDRDNPLGSSYNIWILDLERGDVKRVTNDPSENHMPTWSPDDKEIAFSSTRDGGNSIWAVNVADGTERKVATATGTASCAFLESRMESSSTTISKPTSAASRATARSLTGDENAFAFRVSWASGSDFYYVSDGKIRKRNVNGGEAADGAVQSHSAGNARERDLRPAQARLRFHRAAQGAGHCSARDFARRNKGCVRSHRRYLRDDDRAEAREHHQRPVSSIPIRPGRPTAINWCTRPTKAAITCSFGCAICDTGRIARLTHLATQPQGASWSPDGKRIAFFDVNGIWRAAQVSVVDVETGKVTKLHDTLNAPGMPTWSPDGKRIAMANIAPYSEHAFAREPTRSLPCPQKTARRIPTTNGSRRCPICPSIRADTADRCGRLMAERWRPSMKAFLPSGRCRSPASLSDRPRHMTSEIAYAPSWAGDSEHILYQSLDKLKEIDILTGEMHEDSA